MSVLYNLFCSIKSQNHYADIKYVLKIPLTLGSLSYVQRNAILFEPHIYSKLQSCLHTKLHETYIPLSSKIQEDDTEKRRVGKLKTALEYVMRVKVMRMSEVKGYDCINILKASHDLYQLSFETNDHFTSRGQGIVMNDKNCRDNL